MIDAVSSPKFTGVFYTIKKLQQQASQEARMPEKDDNPL